KAWGTHAYNAPNPWGKGEWANTEGITGLWHVRLDGQGGLTRYGYGNAGFASIRDWHTVQYATNDQPLRAAGVTPVPGGRWVHYGSNRVAFYGVIRTNAIGFVRLDDGAFNLANPTIFDTGSVSDGYAYVELSIPDTGLLSGLTVCAHLHWTHGEPASVAATLKNGYVMNAYAEIPAGVPDKVRIYVTKMDEALNDKVRAVVTDYVQVSIIGFGGWKTLGP